jgi:hypothetical protein
MNFPFVNNVLEQAFMEATYQKHEYEILGKRDIIKLLEHDILEIETVLKIISDPTKKHKTNGGITMKFPFVKTLLNSELDNAKREKRIYDRYKNECGKMYKDQVLEVLQTCEHDILELETVIKMIEKEEEDNE